MFNLDWPNMTTRALQLDRQGKTYQYIHKYIHQFDFKTAQGVDMTVFSLKESRTVCSIVTDHL